MDNPIEVIKRNRYFIEGAPDIPHSSRNHADDLQEYHIPLMRTHHAHLHDLGIAGGLGVSVTAEGNVVEVQPGVAVDGRGELIALSPDGEADISLIAPGEEGRLIGHPFQLNTQDLAGRTLYLTIQFAERLRLTQGVGGKLEQTPWLRLQLVEGDDAFEDDGTAIVLAIVEVDDTGIATVRARDSVLPHGRRLMGMALDHLHIRRAIDDDGAAGHATAAEIGALEKGGIRVSVAAVTDRIVVGRTGGGNFAELTIDAESARFAGALTVQGNLHDRGNLQVDGELNVQGGQHNQGEMQIGGELTVQGAQHNQGNLQVDGALTVEGSLNNRGGLRVDGVTLLQGNVGIGSAAQRIHLTVGDGTNGGLLRFNSVIPWTIGGAGSTLDLRAGADNGSFRIVAENAFNTPLIVKTANAANNNEVYLVPSGGRVGIGTIKTAFQLSLGSSLGNTKLALYEKDASYAYGLGVTAGSFRLHLGNHQARFAFLDSAAANAREIATIGGTGNLVVTGSARKPGGGSWADLSDRELKTDIRQLDGALDTLLRLRGVRFEWREPEKHGNLAGPQIGMIAQEVESVLPDWVSTTQEGYKLLSIRGFEALTVEALRELRTALSNLQAQNAALEALLQQLEITHG